MRRKLMILAAGPEQVPLIQAARDDGVYTLVVDEDATRPGAALADEHLRLSILDEDGCIEQARRHQIDGVASTALSIGMRTVGAVAEALGLAGLRRRSAYYVTDKIAQRERLQQAGVPQPRFQVASNEHEAHKAALAIGLPVVFKPADASGSKGIRVVSATEEIPSAYRTASLANRTRERHGAVLVEEYIRGLELGSEGFVVNGELMLCTLRRVFCTPPPYCQTLGYNYPCDLSLAQQAEIRGYLGQVAQALGLNNTPFHCDMRLRPDGLPAVLEMGARLPGFGMSGDFVPLATGFELFPYAIKLALGESFTLPTLRCQAVAMRFLRLEPGTVASVPDLVPILAMPGVHVLCTELRAGSAVELFVDGSSAMHAGYVVTQGETIQQATERAEAAVGRFRNELRYAD